jgi:hypothetical protein
MSRGFLIGTIAVIVVGLASGVIGWQVRGPAFPVVQTIRTTASPIASPTPLNRAKQVVAHEAFCADVASLPSVVTALRRKRYLRFSAQLGALAKRLDADLRRFLAAGDFATYNRWTPSVGFLTGDSTGPEFFQMVSRLESECHIAATAQ